VFVVVCVVFFVQALVVLIKGFALMKSIFSGEELIIVVNQRHATDKGEACNAHVCADRNSSFSARSIKSFFALYVLIF